VARSLEPYAAWIPVVFASYGIPFESSLGTPALLFPEARSLLQLSRALLADLERESVVELVASRLFRWPHGEASRLPDLAERLARRAGIVHGTESWRRALDRAEDLLREERTWIAPEERERIRRIVEALAREAEKARSARGFGEAVRVVLDAADRWLAVPAETASPGALALDSARAALDSAIPLDVVDRRLARRSGATAEEVLGAFERALRDASVHPYEDSEGVRVLDAVQARALPFRHLLLVGFNDDAWPRPIEEDPFLPDPLRLRLREGLRRPIPLRGEWESDERLLLFLLLSQATETLTLSYRTVDAAGRPSGPSCYLRELPVPEARAAPAHLVPLRDALVEAPLAEGTAALRALAAHAPRELSASLERGLSYLSIVEDFDSADLRFDGGVGRSAPLPERWSASHLEELGHCPLRAFFGRTLRVPRPEERSATEPERRDVGQMVHGALQRLYEELWKSGRLRDGAPLDEAIRMARELLPEIVGTELASASPGSETGTLGLALRDRTAGALLEFVAADLERLLSEGLEELVCEHEFEQPVVVSGAPIVLHGKIDRLVRLRGGRLRISDYKSGAEPVEAVARAEIERGRSLQLPLYVVATASERDAPEIEAEALHTPLRPERTAWRGAEREHPLRLGSPSEVREAVRPALETLVGLVRDGRFPFRRSDRCRWCAYTVSCRREHFASAQRVSLAEPFRPYFELQERET
jgi:RecB family exonuclease